MTKIRCTKSVVIPKDGLAAAYPYVSSGSILVTGNTAGSVTDYSNAKSTFRFYADGVELDLSTEIITVKVSTSRILYTLTNEIYGLGKVLNITLFPPSLSQEWIDLSFTHNGIVYTKRVNLSKIKNGALGNQLVYDDSNFYVLTTDAVNPFSHVMSGLSLNQGDTIKVNFGLLSSGSGLVNFVVNTIQNPMSLGISDIDNYNNVTIYLKIISYNSTTGQLVLSITTIVERYQSIAGSTVTGTQKYVSMGYSSNPVYVSSTPSSATITIGIASVSGVTFVQRVFNVEFKQNYNNTLIQW